MYNIENGRVTNALGEVALIISPGYGGTWPHDRFTPEVVMAVLEGKDAHTIAEVVTNTYPEHYVRWPYSASETLAVEWLAPGSKYRVLEYDGAEYLEVPDDITWQTI